MVSVDLVMCERARRMMFSVVHECRCDDRGAFLCS